MTIEPPPPSPSDRRGRWWTVGEDEGGTRLDKFLAAEGRMTSRARVLAALDRGKVFVNGSEVDRQAAGRRLVPGEVVGLWLDRPGSARKKPGPVSTPDLEMLYVDDALIVLNKPSGLLTVPLERRGDAPSAYGLLEDHLRPKGKRRPLVVHRIDRDTSGLVVFAREGRAQQQLRDQFRRREPERVYLAVVYGHPDPEHGTWRDHLVWDRKSLIQRRTRASDPMGKEAVSEYRVLERFPGTALIEVRLRTGKRNQIRIQARLRGHTLIGEQRYVFGPAPLRPVAFPRQALHAWRLGFRHPSDGRQLKFEAPVPADLQGLLERLRRQGSA